MENKLPVEGSTRWPKRKEIKANSDDDGKELSSLKPGDAVRVKFGSRWYDAEVCEGWEPTQSKKGKYIEHYISATTA